MFPVAHFHSSHFVGLILLSYSALLFCLCSTKDVSPTRTAVVTRSVLTVESATRQWSAATAVQTASVDVRRTTILSAPASRPAGRFHRVPATETADTATSARCTLTSPAQRHNSLAPVCDPPSSFLNILLYVDPEFTIPKGMTVNLINRLDVPSRSCAVDRCTSTSATRSASTTCRSAAACATGSVAGRRGVECDLPQVPGLRASDGEPYSSVRVVATSPACRRHPPRPTTYRISCRNSAIRASLGCSFAPRTVRTHEHSKWKSSEML